MMIDLDKIGRWCIAVLCGAVLVAASHIATMKLVTEDINRWRAVSIESQELADRCIEALEDSTTPTTPIL